MLTPRRSSLLLAALLALTACDDGDREDGGGQAPGGPAVGGATGAGAGPGPGPSVPGDDRKRRPGSRQRRQPGRAVVTVEDPGSAPMGVAGVVAGVVELEGEPPLRPPIAAIAGTAGCLHRRAGGEAEVPRIEQVIVEDGKLSNVVVYIKKMPRDYVAPEPPAEPHVIDQRQCLYVPHVSAIQAGRPVVAANGDPMPHNVHVTGIRNQGFNRTIGPGGRREELPLPLADQVRLTCDIHPWMGAHLWIFEHPFFAVTGPDGRFEIDGLPSGTYRLEAWHERYGTLRCGGLAVGPGGRISVQVTYEQD